MSGRHLASSLILIGALCGAAVAEPTTRPLAATRPSPTTRPLVTTRPFPTTRPAPATRPASQLKTTLENLQDLRALQDQVEAIAKRVGPAVVGVRVGRGQGSGVIVSDDGYVLTAGHVASAPNRDVELILPDGKIVRGKTLGINYGADSGLIRITSPPTSGDKWPYAAIGNSGQLVRGQWCIAMGHPGGYRVGRSPPLRLGRILDSRGNMIRTDCTLVGGDSGGPLFDLDGNVIGIHSRIGGSLNDNMHVPVDTYRETWERLANGDAWGAVFFGSRPGGPYLGLQVDAEAADCRIGEIFPDGPAEKSGLKPGDVITSFAGQKVVNFGELMLKLSSHKPGDEVPLEIKRDDKTVKLTITIGKRPANNR
jgi:serine protease Do